MVKNICIYEYSYNRQPKSCYLRRSYLIAPEQGQYFRNFYYKSHVRELIDKMNKLKQLLLLINLSPIPVILFLNYN